MVYQDRPFVERIDRAADLGVEAVEFWEWSNKDLDAVTTRLAEHDLDLVGMVGAGTEDPDLTDPDQHEQAVARIEASIATARELGRPNLMVLSGQAQADMDRASQHDAVVSVLEDVTPSAEAADVTLLLEPLNTAVDHPNHYLESSGEGFEILEEVDSPALQLLFDIYHQQVSEGNIIDSITNDIDRIGHVHVADVPGRHEPGEGELHYENILQAIDDAGYEEYVGYEFEPARDSDAAIRSIWNE